jgi:hypothetical protein
MSAHLKKDWQAAVAFILFLILSAWWLYGFLNPEVYKTRFYGDYPSIYGIMALWGAFWGIIISKQYGFVKSVMGKAILMFALGLLAQEAGQIIYAYYSFYQHIGVPYPSFGDIGYFGSIPLYIYGVWLLGKASGIQIRLRSILNQSVAVGVPIIMLGIAYFLFLQSYTFDWSNPLKIFLDFGYPFGQAFYISLAAITYLLSRGILGGMMKSNILFILFALCIQFLCDYTFLYQSSRGTWTAGGPNDYMYLIAYFVMTLGLLRFGNVLIKLKSTQTLK